MALISQKTLDQIYDYPLSQAFGSFLSLKKAGTVYKGLSPFAEEKSPSFIVSDAKGIWKDFGTGKGGKNLISFLIAKENLDFPSAVIKAAKELNIPIQYEEETQIAKDEREHSEVLRDMVQKANATYQKNFKNLDGDHWAKKYMLETRGFTPEILETFDIGFAFPDSRLSPILKNDGLLVDALEVGLMKENQHGGIGHYDFFRDRIIFPIYDKKTHCVAFGGRINPEADQSKSAKYLNSSDSKIYHKSNVLYGFNLAKESIRYFGYVILVEGYTDVLRMHQVGFDNTIASCGTALTKSQILEIKKITKKVVLFFDGDSAGQKAVVRNMALLLVQGMTVEVVAVENKEDDPDTIGQRMGKETISYVSALMEDAILYQVKKSYNGFYEEASRQREKEDEEEFERTGKKPKAKKIILSPQNKKQFLEDIGSHLSHISDYIIKNQYVKDLVNRYSEISSKELTDTISDKEEEKRPKFLSNQDHYDYELPHECTVKLADVIDDIKEYGIFQSDNKIYAYKLGGYFDCVSNFSVEIVQHMQDENFPMKLIRVCNVFNVEKIFDVKSDLINSLPSFKNVVTSYGNYFFSGTPSDHESMLKYLFDKMGHGRKIEILGWQPEGFWVWNNKVIIPGNREEEVNKEGLIKFQKESYYVPSANKNYANNMFKFGPQKKFKSIETNITHGQYFSQVYKVHREHAITGILFGITSIYQDIVTSSLNFFPILFYFGPASTGKDNLCAAIQSLMGLPQTAIQLEGGASTIKAQIREFSQFNNGISQLAEYKRGDPKLDGLIKGLWDRRGYKRGSLESKVATDEIPILCSTLLTGNDFPDAEALITRLLWEEMKAQEFDDKAKLEFNKLADMVKHGVSSLSDHFINKRAYVEELFLEKYRANVKLLNDLPQFSETTSRIISNHAVLLTTYHLFESEINFPFTQSEIINHFANMVDNQKRKLATASPFIKFWDCFAMCMRGNVMDQLKINQDLRIDGGTLMFNFKNAFMKVQRMWLSQYQETAPDQRRMKEILSEDSSFVKDGYKTRVNKDENNTSVFVVDMSKLGEAKDNILHNMNVQLNTGTLFSAANTEEEESSAVDRYSKINDLYS